MGQQQLLLIILGAIIVGMAVYGVLQVIDSYNQSQERDLIIQRLNILAGEAKKYAAKLHTFGGGEGSFLGFSPPANLTNTSGFRINTTASDTWVLFQGFGTTIGSDGKTPVQIVGQFDRTADQWSTLTVVN